MLLHRLRLAALDVCVALWIAAMLFEHYTGTGWWDSSLGTAIIVLVAAPLTGIVLLSYFVDGVRGRS